MLYTLFYLALIGRFPAMQILAALEKAGYEFSDYDKGASCGIEADHILHNFEENNPETLADDEFLPIFEDEIRKAAKDSPILFFRHVEYDELGYDCANELFYADADGIRSLGCFSFLDKLTEQAGASEIIRFLKPIADPVNDPGIIEDAGDSIVLNSYLTLSGQFPVEELKHAISKEDKKYFTGYEEVEEDLEENSENSDNNYFDFYGDLTIENNLITHHFDTFHTTVKYEDDPFMKAFPAVMRETGKKNPILFYKKSDTNWNGKPEPDCICYADKDGFYSLPIETFFRKTADSKFSNDMVRILKSQPAK